LFTKQRLRQRGFSLFRTATSWQGLLTDEYEDQRSQ
jgi:hypothetical protein